MKFIILASGSKGNSTLVISENGDLLLIDVGVPYKEISEKISRYGYDVNCVKNILITHEHEDHIKSIKHFSNAKKYSLKEIGVSTVYVEKYKETQIGDFEVIALPLSHDVKCCGFVIKENNEKLVYITDTGYINYKIRPYLKDADYYIFESNHNVEMLMETKRPFYIKSRILGDEGHLSNEDAGEVLCESIGERTKQIYLAHISREANTKDLAIKTLYDIALEKNVSLEKVFVNAADQNIELVGGNSYEKSTIAN